MKKGSVSVFGSLIQQGSLKMLGITGIMMLLIPLLQALVRTVLLLKEFLDNSNYKVSLYWSDRSVFEEKEKHYFLLTPQSTKNNSYELTCLFEGKKALSILTGFKAISKNSAEAWKKFWQKRRRC
jgi:hypothetical protein